MDLFFEDPDVLERRDPIDVGGSGLALWGSTDSSLDSSSLSCPLPDPSLEDACVFGELFTFLMDFLASSSVKVVTVEASSSTCAFNALESSSPTRRAER